MIFMEEKAQAALEYLLIISGAVLVAAAVIVFMTDFLPRLFCQTETEMGKFNELTHS